MPVITRTTPQGAASEPAAAVELKYTRHGPVIFEDKVHHKAYAVRAGWMETGTAPYLATLRMDQARNWQEFESAAGFARMPALNFVWGGKDRSIDMSPVGQDLGERRPGHHAAPCPAVALPLGLIIAVEQEGETIVVERIALHEIAQDEGLEKPGRMGQVPFGGRRILHRLDRGIGIGERRDQRLCQRANASEPRRQRVTVLQRLRLCSHSVLLFPERALHIRKNFPTPNLHRMRERGRARIRVHSRAVGDDE